MKFIYLTDIGCAPRGPLVLNVSHIEAVDIWPYGTRVRVHYGGEHRIHSVAESVEEIYAVLKSLTEVK